MNARAGSLAGRLLLSLVVLLLALTSSPAFAAGDPTAGPKRKDPLPVQVQLTSISPTLSQGDQPIQVTARLTNIGDRAITDLWVRLQRDRRIDDRAGLLAVDHNQPAYSSALGEETTLSITLEPGQTETIELTVPPSELAIYDTGSYPILLNLQGSIGGQEGRVGQAAFTMPRTGTTATTPLSVSWVLPLIDRPHRSDEQQVFTDDELVNLIEDGGRLENILTVAEKYAATAKPTLMVDPELVDELVAMSSPDGYEIAEKGGTKRGTGGEQAAAFLDRLTKVAETSPIAITPYADVDTVALVRAGLRTVVTQARAAGAEIVAEALKVAPVTDLAWPADGILTDAALEVLGNDGVSTVLLSGSSFGQTDYLASADDVTESAATALPGTRGVVADPGLSRLLTDGTTYAAGPAAAAQRIAAELATIAAQAPERARNVVLLPPRGWEVSGELAERLMSLTTSSPWLTPTALADVANGDPQDRGALQYPADQSNRELPEAALARLKTPIGQVADLGPAFSGAGDRDQILGPVDEIIFRAASSAWRGGDEQVVTGAQAAADSLEAIREQIRIVPPSNGSYTLSASDAPLVFTVENNLRVPVHFRIGLDPRQSSGLSPTDIGVQTIPALSRATVQVPTKVIRSGTFSVVAQISTPEGKPLGKDVEIRVSSTAYGTVALWVTGAAFAMLLALIARRWWRRHQFWKAERAQRRDGAEAAADDEQPVRSPEAASAAGHPTRDTEEEPL